MVVVGRDSELADIDAWINASATVATGPASRPTVLEIEGDAGIGKTTLWAEVGRRAASQGWIVLTCRPSASDARLSFVGLADLLAPIPQSAFEALPAPQRRPLEVALLRAEAGEGDLDRRAVGSGFTALLRTLADQAPLLLGVDDCQWLDTESAWAVGFCLRRLEDRPVLLMAAARTPGSVGGGQVNPFAAVESDLSPGRIHRVRVGPLTVAAIHGLLRDRLGARLPRPTLVRIHRVARGNPFYALEIAREVLLRGPPAPGEPIPIPADHGEIALLRLRRLPASTRQALMRVAALSRPETRLS